MWSDGLDFADGWAAGDGSSSICHVPLYVNVTDFTDRGESDLSSFSRLWATRASNTTADLPFSFCLTLYSYDEAWVHCLKTEVGPEVAEGRWAAAPSSVLHWEMERHGRETVRGIDEQKIEGQRVFFKDEACGLDVHTFTSRRAFKDEMITSVRIRNCGGMPNITKTLVQKSVWSSFFGSSGEEEENIWSLRIIMSALRSKILHRCNNLQKPLKTRQAGPFYSIQISSKTHRAAFYLNCCCLTPKYISDLLSL